MRRAHIQLGTLIRIQILHILSAKSERGAGDGAGEIESLCDLAPELLVDDLDEAAF